MVGGLSYLLRSACVITRARTDARLLTGSIFALSSFFLTASFAHLRHIRAHTNTHTHTPGVLYLSAYSGSFSSPLGSELLRLFGWQTPEVCLPLKHTHTQARHCRVNLSLSPQQTQLLRRANTSAPGKLFSTFLCRLGGGAVTQTPGGV